MLLFIKCFLCVLRMTFGMYCICLLQAKVCMFPEGTRNNGPDLLPFKKGAFHVAIASQTAILPVVVSHYHFLDSERHVFDKGTGNLVYINYTL